MTATEVFLIVPQGEKRFPLALSRVSAGFPSPADDFLDRTIDLNEHLVRHPAATFFMRVEGESMRDAGIHDGDILIVDRAEEPADGKVVVAAVWGNLVVKRLRKVNGAWELHSENPAYDPIVVNDSDSTIWGVVTNVIHKV